MNNKIKLTNNDKFAHSVMDGSDYTSFRINEDSIDDMILNDKKTKFNEEVDK